MNESGFNFDPVEDEPGNLVPVISEVLPERYFRYREIGFVPCGPGWVARDLRSTAEFDVIGWSHQETDLEDALSIEDLGQETYDAAIRLHVDDRRHWRPVVAMPDGTAQTVDWPVAVVSHGTSPGRVRFQRLRRHW